MLTTIDFVLAAPVLAQEKRQAHVNVAHIPKEAITVLGKRSKVDELAIILKDNLENGPSDSEESHSSSSSAPSGPEHESTNIVPPPAPDPASSTANRGPGSSSTTNVVSGEADPWWYEGDGELLAGGSPHTVSSMSSGYASPDDEFAEAHWSDTPPKPDSWLDSEPSTVSDFEEWDYRMIPEGPPPLPVRPPSPKESGQAYEDQTEVGHVNPPPESADAPSLT